MTYIHANILKVPTDLGLIEFLKIIQQLEGLDASRQVYKVAESTERGKAKLNTMI